LITFTNAFDIPVTPTIDQLFIYPIKSMSGVSIPHASITDRGLQYDRRWMLVDAFGRFITQREEPRLCFFSVEAQSNGMTVNSLGGLQGAGSIVLPWTLQEGQSMEVSVWSDRCSALIAPLEVNDFFSNALQRDCRLVYMPDESKRPVDLTYSISPALAAFGDGYPVLLIGTASLVDLNNRLTANNTPALGWDRFRPNVVVRTVSPFDEDEWATFEIGGIGARGVKLCSRCVFTTIDQITGVASAEPLRTLASYRRMNNKVMFGQHVIWTQTNGIIRVGDDVNIQARQLPPNAGF